MHARSSGLFVLGVFTAGALSLAAACGSPTPATSASGSESGSSTQASAGSTGAGESASTASASGSTGATTGASASASATSSGASAGSTSGSTGGESSGAMTDGTGTGVTASATDTDPTSGPTSGPECVADEECPAPPSMCLAPACDGGACGVQASPPGTPCDEEGGSKCDGEGSCVECLADDECPTKLCQLGVCAPASCGDGIKNGSETDVDCGGLCPQTCGDGQGCVGGGDCQSGVCTNNTCKAASCADDVKNGAETDVDCGGGSCPGCADGEACGVGGDCLGGICQQNACASPSCADGKKNGSETDVDCGGGCPEKCANDEGCTIASDCVSGYCEAGVCKPMPGPACKGAPADPITGQRCPLFSACTQSSECGTNTGCQLWFCNNSKRCELDAIGGCGKSAGGGCNADVVISHYYTPPVDKTFVPPDGVDFRELASIAFVVKNNTTKDLFIDAIPLALDTMNGGSKFDVSSTKLFEDAGHNGEHEPGSFFLCVTDKTFQFPANGTMTKCGNLNQSKIPKGGSEQFIINLAFAKELGYITGRSYRLRLPTTVGFGFKEGTVFGPAFAGTICGIPGEGFTGAWVTAKQP